LNEQTSLGSRDQFSITEVEDLTGLTPRTVRFYITEGLIPPAHGRGPSAKYDRSQVMRLRLVQQYKSERLPLDEIKNQLNNLSDRQVASILNADAEPIGESWRRIPLHPDIELHVRSQSMPEGSELEETIGVILEQVRPLIDRMSRRQNGRIIER
jgi:DNA-binding transcriptional MerR regulator